MLQNITTTAYNAELTLLNAKAENKIIIESIIKIILPRDNEGKYLLIILDAISVPPVVPPLKNTRDNPVPDITPPYNAVSNPSPLNEGKIGDKVSINTEDARVAYIVLNRKSNPKYFIEIMNKGKFKTTINIPTGSANRWFNIIAIPVIPPGAMLLGDVNTTTEIAYNKLPKDTIIRSKKVSFTFASLKFTIIYHPNLYYGVILF